MWWTWVPCTPPQPTRPHVRTRHGLRDSGWRTVSARRSPNPHHPATFKPPALTQVLPRERTTVEAPEGPPRSDAQLSVSTIQGELSVSPAEIQQLSERFAEASCRRRCGPRGRTAEPRLRRTRTDPTRLRAPSSSVVRRAVRRPMLRCGQPPRAGFAAAGLGERRAPPACPLPVPAVAQLASTDPNLKKVRGRAADGCGRGHGSPPAVLRARLRRFRRPQGGPSGAPPARRLFALVGSPHGRRGGTSCMSLPHPRTSCGATESHPPAGVLWRSTLAVRWRRS